MEERNDIEEGKRRCQLKFGGFYTTLEEGPSLPNKIRILYNPGRRCHLAKKRPSLRQVVEEYGLKVLVSRAKLLEVEIVQL